MKRILLVGAGHAHAWLLTSLARAPVYGARFTLVSPTARQVYSAMLPGVIAGHYRRQDAEFDVAMLAERGYAEFMQASVVRFDADRHVATLNNGRELPFDFASLNAGSRTENTVPGAEDYALSVKPFDQLFDKLRKVSHVAVAGGGAAGAELAMALRYRGGEVTLYADHPTFSPPLARRLERELRRRRVDYRPGMHVDAVEEGPVIVAGAARQSFDLVLWATGPAPHPWVTRSGLKLDGRGFVQVDRALRSVSHPHIFAVGDCAALDEPKSGVQSVRHGMLLADNVRRLVAGAALEPYVPNPKALMLLSCGARYAIAARGDWSAQGRWVWWWKNAIDRRWMRRLNETRTSSHGS